MSEFLNKIKRTIEKYNMIKSGDRVLVALSGGADSVCLLKSLISLKEKFDITVFAAHLNHMIRGKEADADEEFARDLCEKCGVQFFSRKENVLEYAEKNSLTSEEAGRNLRYGFFAELCKEHDIQKIATAHNLNDNAETVMMRFIRGTSLAGLAGIPYVNGNIIRPLLDVSRDEIEGYLLTGKSSFVTDKTNAEPIYFRNKIRLNLIPEIEENYNPNFKETLSKNIEGYKLCADFIKNISEEKASKLINVEKSYCYIDIKELKKEHDFIISNMIVESLDKMSCEKQITSRAVQDILRIVKEEIGAVEFSKDIYVCVIYNKLFFVDKQKIKKFNYSIEKTEELYIKEYNKKIIFTEVEKKEKENGAIFIDYDKIAGKKLVIRSRKDGDFFVPSGMSGKKKLKDYFIDKKIPFFMRDEIPVFLADDEIVCVGNFRESENFKVKSDTKHILKIQMISGG